MNNLRRFLHVIATGTAMGCAAAPALAWEEQGAALKSLPGGGLMLKEVPGTDGSLRNLPGVRLNPQLGGGGNTSCTQRQVTGYRYGFGEQSATVNECNFGNFSVSTMRGTSSGNAWGWMEGVPQPFGAGPPPGSGGFAPRPFN